MSDLTSMQRAQDFIAGTATAMSVMAAIYKIHEGQLGNMWPEGSDKYTPEELAVLKLDSVAQMDSLAVDGINTMLARWSDDVLAQHYVGIA